MFWYLGEDYDGWRFVYDDLDKSVEFLPVSEIKGFGVDISGRKPFGVCNDYAKLRVIGFQAQLESELLTYHVCTYFIGSVVINMSLVILGTANLGLDFCSLKSGNPLDISVRMPCYGFDDLRADMILQSIPVEMLYWILDLKSRQDFNGILNAYHGLLSERIKLLVPVIPREVNFLNW